MSATETKVSREVIEDRYRRLLGQGHHPTELQTQLDDVTWALIEGVAQRPLGGQEEDAANLVDDAQAAMRELIVRRVDELGLAR